MITTDTSLDGLAGALEMVTARFAGGHATLRVIVNKQGQPREYLPARVLEGGIYRQLSPAETVNAGIDYYQALLEAALKKLGNRS